MSGFGATNMRDRPMATIARAVGADKAADWIEAHRSEFANGIVRGFVADEGPGAAG